MRKGIAWLLALCLLLTALPVWAEEAAEEAAEESNEIEEDSARVAINLQAIKVMLDDSELTFRYQEETDCFVLTSTLESEAESAILWLTAYDDGVFVQADYDVDVPQERWDEMLRFCSLCNEDVRLGCFYLDRENSSVGYKFFIYSDVLPPTQDALVYAVVLAVKLLDYQGDAFMAVLNGAAATEALEITLE